MTIFTIIGWALLAWVGLGLAVVLIAWGWIVLLWQWDRWLDGWRMRRVAREAEAWLDERERVES